MPDKRYSIVDKFLAFRNLVSSTHFLFGTLSVQLFLRWLLCPFDTFYLLTFCPFGIFFDTLSFNTLSAHEIQRSIIHILILKVSNRWQTTEIAKWKCVVFHQDDTRHFVFSQTLQQLFHINWDVLLHPPFTLDVTSSDYRISSPRK